MPRQKIYKEILNIALEALESRRAELASKIAVVQQALGAGSNRPFVKSTGRKRTLSTAARRRIAEAQRKRWRLARQRNVGKKAALTQKRAKKKA